MTANFICKLFLLKILLLMPFMALFGQKNANQQPNEPYKVFLENSEKIRMRYVRMLRDSLPKYGFQSKQVIFINKKIEKLDSSDVATFLGYEKKYGFPKISIYGAKASNAAFLIVQHSNPAMMQKYFKTIKKLAAKNEAHLTNVALMQDRILMDKKKKQLYGTQYVSATTATGTDTMYVYAIKDIKNIDKRRRKMGLGSFKAFLDEYGYSYPNYIYRKE